MYLTTLSLKGQKTQKTKTEGGNEQTVVGNLA